MALFQECSMALFLQMKVFISRNSFPFHLWMYSFTTFIAILLQQPHLYKSCYLLCLPSTPTFSSTVIFIIFPFVLQDFFKFVIGLQLWFFVLLWNLLHFFSLSLLSQKLCQLIFIIFYCQIAISLNPCISYLKYSEMILYILALKPCISFLKYSEMILYILALIMVSVIFCIFIFILERDNI